ncbi:MAG: ROK family transcriptional regulator [Sporichthyaceae bacterium]|nr:ROK family transcriptional regulator [Sporichthyaceae bacterium]
MSALDLWCPAGLNGNARRVAEVLRARGPSTRAQLARATHLSRPTISATITELTAAGVAVELAAGVAGELAAATVVEAAPGPDRRAGARSASGRPAGVVRLTRQAGLAVGVDVGRRHIRVAVADLGHDILLESATRLEEDADDAPQPVLDRAASMIEQALAEVRAGSDEVVGIGMGVPAPMTLDGRIGAPRLLPGWGELSPGHELSARLGIPVQVNNDANLGALGEFHWGAGRGASVLVYVKLATGIGAGIVLDGELFRGSAGTAGELGHITIDARGPVCRCGNRGCVELAAGGRALVAQARHTYPELADVADLVELANSGDPGCRRLLTDAGTQIGLALSGLVNLINPERILLGGELGNAADLMLDPLRRGLAESAMPAAVETVTVLPGELGDRAAALGGVLLVMRAPTRT